MLPIHGYLHACTYVCGLFTIVNRVYNYCKLIEINTNFMLTIHSFIGSISSGRIVCGTLLAAWVPRRSDLVIVVAWVVALRMHWRAPGHCSS